MNKDKAIKEIKQLKELLDSGIITQDEYDVKSVELKKIILDLDKNKEKTSENEIKKQVKVKKEKDENLTNLKTESSSEKPEILSKKKEEIINESDKNRKNKGFRSWLNKKESAFNNFLIIALGWILIPTYFLLFNTFQNYVIGLADGSVAYGEYPFEKGYKIAFIWLYLGVPIFLLLSYLISLIKSLRIKMVKVFFLFTILLTLVFLRIVQNTIYPALSITKENTEKTQKKLAEAYLKDGLEKMEAKNYKGALSDFNRAIKLNPNYDKLYKNRADAKYDLYDFQGAIVDINKAISLNPKRYNNYILRGIMKCKKSSIRNCEDCKDIVAGYAVAKENSESFLTIIGIKRDFPSCF